MKSRVLSILLFIFLLALISCSGGVPQSTQVKASAVFDYTDEEALPAMRFSAFAQADIDVRRVSSIRVQHRQTGLIWDCFEPELLPPQNEKSWAGYSAFAPATGKSIPSGIYDFFYIDAAGEECEGSFELFYPDSLLSARATGTKDILREYKEKYAVYDSLGVLLYYNEAREEWQSPADALRAIKNAAYMRVCYETLDGSVVCLLPSQKIEE